MPGTRQLTLVAALGRGASACLAATFYASWQGYGGRRFAVTLCVFALLFAAEILVAARGVQESVATFFSMRSPLSLAIVLASLLFIAYLVTPWGQVLSSGSARGLLPPVPLFPRCCWPARANGNRACGKTMRRQQRSGCRGKFTGCTACGLIPKSGWDTSWQCCWR